MAITGIFSCRLASMTDPDRGCKSAEEQRGAQLNPVGAAAFGFDSVFR